MAPRFHAARHRRLAILLAAIISAAPAASFAQDPRPKRLPDAPAKLPKVQGDKTKGLDFLFGALRAAPDEASAKHDDAREDSDGCPEFRRRAKTSRFRRQAAP